MEAFTGRFKLEHRGLEVWQLGVEKNWTHLATFLKETGVEDLRVTDRAEEDALANARRLIEASRSPDDRRLGLVSVMLGPEGGDSAQKLLKRVLALGLDPDCASGAGWRPSHLATAYSRAKCAVLVSLCRPDLSARTDGGCSPLDLTVSLALSLENQKLKTRLLEIWSGVLTNGFATIAKLAFQKDFWAVKNLCRRRVVPESEARQLHDGKDVFQWAQHHGELKLVEELRYLLESPGVPHRPSNAERAVEMLSKRVADLEAGRSDVALAAAGESKELEDVRKTLALTKSTVEESLEKMRSGAEDRENRISLRLEKLRKDQTQDLQVAFSELLVELQALEGKVDACCSSSTVGSGVAVAVGGSKEVEETNELLALAKSTAEEKLAEMRSISMDFEGLLSRRLETFRKDQDARMQELKDYLDGRRRKNPTAEEKPTAHDDPLRLVVSGLLAKVEGIAASGVSFALVEDLLALVKKHETENGPLK